MSPTFGSPLTSLPWAFCNWSCVEVPITKLENNEVIRIVMSYQNYFHYTAAGSNAQKRWTVYSDHAMEAKGLKKKRKYQFCYRWCDISLINITVLHICWRCRRRMMVGFRLPLVDEKSEVRSVSVLKGLFVHKKTRGKYLDWRSISMHACDINKTTLFISNESIRMNLDRCR